MTLAQWVVLAAGVASIALVNWWFFFAEGNAGEAAEGASGLQEVRVLVRGGYEPSRIRVKSGRPVRLVFDRQETNSCSEEIVFPDFGVRRFLPAFQKTAIEFTPDRPGRFEFTCGMSMLHGRLDVE